MTSIRVTCPTAGCDDAAIELTPERRPGMMTGTCPRCGTFWHMKAGVLHALGDDAPSTPHDRR